MLCVVCYFNVVVQIINCHHKWYLDIENCFLLHSLYQFNLIKYFRVSSKLQKPKFNSRSLTQCLSLVHSRRSKCCGVLIIFSLGQSAKHELLDDIWYMVYLFTDMISCLQCSIPWRWRQGWRRKKAADSGLECSPAWCHPGFTHGNPGPSCTAQGGSRSRWL